MDLSHIVTQVWGAFHWFILPILLIGLLNSAWGKGHTGELRLRLFARLHLDKRTYRRMHNVTLNTIDGTTQIDHVFISPYGIFVVETKNISGWIFGSERQPQWTQKLYQTTYKFQNPLRQNYKHLKALEVALGVVPEHLHSVIVFVGASSFKTDMPANVTQGKGFIRYIKSFKQPVFTEAEVDALMQALRTGRLSPSRATQRAHVQNLKRRNDPTAERKCPKCGSELLIRTVKSGPNAGQQFWGCSAFPKCRVTQRLS